MHKAYDYDLLAHNTFNISVRAKSFITYDSIEELQELIKIWQDEGFPKRLLHIGGGSNLLFTKDFDGTILHSKIRGITAVSEDEQHIVVSVGAGEVWDDFVAHCVKQGWYGIENLSLIPGEVGASAVQNIGAYGVEVEQYVLQVKAINLASGKLTIFKREELAYGYRTSVFKHELKGQYAIVEVLFQLNKTFVPNLSYTALRNVLPANASLSAEEIRETVISIRKSKIPDTKLLGSGGSFFMNPVVDRNVFERIQQQYPTMPFYDLGKEIKIPAGWLIEQCGWKGKRIGNAGVYEKQALILVNHGGCSGQEIAELSQHIVTDVKTKFGIEIHPEINFV